MLLCAGQAATEKPDRQGMLIHQAQVRSPTNILPSREEQIGCFAAATTAAQTHTDTDEH